MERNLVSLILIFFISFYAFSQEIYQWRGPNRDGMYKESKLLKTWPVTGPELLWFSEIIGDGYGSPCVTSDKLFINGEIDSISHVFAFDLKGNLLWKTPNGKEFTGSGFSGRFTGSRSTPTVYGELVYSCSGIGRITCIEKQSGKEKWATEMTANLNGIMPYFGYSESLVVDEKNVYCFPGGANTNAAAINRMTGKVVWTSKALSDTMCYTSPLLINLPARKILVTLTTYYIMGIDAGNGELLWSQKQENVKQKQQCNTPLYENGFIYYVAGDGNGAVKLELSPDGKSIKEIWRNNNILNNFNGFLKISNHIISSDRSQKIKLFDVGTGAIVDTVKVNRGALISADDMIYCYSENGDVSLFKLTGTKLELASKFKLEKGTKEHFAHPVISNGNLYIRHGKSLMAYHVKEK